MIAVRNCGAFVHRLNTTEREVLRESIVLGLNMRFTYLSNLFYEYFSVPTYTLTWDEVWKKCLFFFFFFFLGKAAVTFVRLELKLIYVDKFNQKSKILNLNLVKTPSSGSCTSCSFNRRSVRRNDA
jgi:hypothetical protein